MIAPTPKTFWEYHRANPGLETPSLQEAIRLGAIRADTTQEQWEQMSPGMRREIVRSAKKKSGAQDALFRYNGVNSHGNRISGVTNAPSLEAAREELERYYETVQVFPAGLGERPAEMRAGGKRVSFAGDTTMKFACDAMPCEGMIINKIGSYLIFEGMAADSGSYFVRNPSISDTRRFDSRADAEDWAREIAMDIDPYKTGSIKDNIRKEEKALRRRPGKPQATPLNLRGYVKAQEPKGKDAEMATDPPVSEAQRKAMGAAKSGHSTLGIPSSVGKEFIDADPGGKLPKKAKDEWSDEARRKAAESRARGSSSSRFGLMASHPSGAGPKFKTNAGSHSEVESHMGNLRKSHPEHQVTVQNHGSGQVHTFRSGEKYNPAFVGD